MEIKFCSHTESLEKYSKGELNNYFQLYLTSKYRHTLSVRLNNEKNALTLENDAFGRK